mgnify:FL=1
MGTQGVVLCARGSSRSPSRGRASQGVLLCSSGVGPAALPLARLQLVPFACFAQLETLFMMLRSALAALIGAAALVEVDAFFRMPLDNLVRPPLSSSRPSL